MSGGSKVQTTRTEPWEQQKPYLETGFQRAEDLYSTGAMTPAYYGTVLDPATGSYVTDPTKPTLAGFTPAEQAAQQAALTYAMSPATEQFMGKAQGGLGGMLDYGTGAMDYGAAAARPMTTTEYGTYTPFGQGQYEDLIAGNVNTAVFGPLADAYRQEAMGQLTGEVLPGIRTAITQSQAGGGTRGDILQANAVAAAQQRISDNLAKAEFDAYQQAQNRRMDAAQMGLGAQQAAMGYGMSGADAARGALGQYPATLQAPLSMTDAASAVGGQQRAMDQAAIDRDMQRYEYQTQAPITGLQNYLAGISGEYGGTSQAVGPGGPSPAMGIAAALAGNPALFTSDVRVKENIAPAGKWKDHNAYTFNYIGDDTRYRSVMAQEVEQTHPQAVVEIAGIKHVDYSKL